MPTTDLLLGNIYFILSQPLHCSLARWYGPFLHNLFMDHYHISPWIQWLNHGFLVARQLPCIHTNKCWIFQHLLVGSYKISLRARWHSKIYLTLLQFFDRNLPTCSKNLEFRIWSFHPDIGLSFKQCYSKVRIPRFRFRVTLLLLLTLFACYPRDHIQSIDVYCCKEAWGTHQKVLSYTKLRHSTTLNRIILVHSVRNVQ